MQPFPNPTLNANQTPFGQQPVSQNNEYIDENYQFGLPYEPKPFEMPIGIASHLSISNLVEIDDKIKEKANYFLCSICMEVVVNPKECKQCSTLYCAECIDTWLNSNPTCPKKCPGVADFSSLNRYARNDLLDLHFKCPISDCNVVLPYEKALSHLTSCDFKMAPCP